MSFELIGRPYAVTVELEGELRSLYFGPYHSYQAAKEAERNLRKDKSSVLKTVIAVLYAPKDIRAL